jgi:tyrosine aminotransferase
MPPCPTIIKAITQSLNSPGMAAGYVNACGTPEARAAIAAHHSASLDDVIVANGASGALELALTALLDEGSILLVPRPGFPLYGVIAQSHGASVVQYDLLPDREWECDLDHIESILIELDKRSDKGNERLVRGILINNPSNPTGAVYSREHLMKVAQLAAKYRIPIISDEIYGDMTLNGRAFHPMADVVEELGKIVPVITASGIGKQYLVPGWRLGWIVFHDSNSGSIQEVKKGAQRLAQVILGASHLAQIAIPAVLRPSAAEDELALQSWKEELHSLIQNQANLLCRLLNKCHGLEVIFPQGAMYAMVKIYVEMFDDSILDDLTFMSLLLKEENIVVLPGKAFGITGEYNVFRVVFCAPEHVIRAAADRISGFCIRHKHLKK